ncbi:MAG: CBS domain-containing protein [Alphaproteobacteria bacterium]|nr:CBS domain-containing protein [Alphaproteobacteria bacterium]MBP7759228.1 CBS domain-containing protein [Alphaproteobacteria bacterium]MBP7761862.1 CBS domain-containing protein [Alphaproteobacteria bacterium]MBP7904693.1 CBS domain-containing protein [Alphaproteobacteria bacterium]
MPCHVAIEKNTLRISPDDDVESAINKLKQGKVNSAPVVDEQGHLLGLFSFKGLMRNLVPVSVAMADGIKIDIKVGAAPGVARRLANVKPLMVTEVLDRKVQTVGPEEPLWEGVSLLTNHGGPLAVIDDQNRLLGMISYTSMLELLEKTEDGAE